MNRKPDSIYKAFRQSGGTLTQSIRLLQPENNLVPSRNALGRQFFQSLTSSYHSPRVQNVHNLTHCPASARKEHLYNLALRVALLIRHSLDVHVHGSTSGTVRNGLSPDTILVCFATMST